MAVETVTNYKCDRCGRSEIIDHVEIMTLTVRKRTSGTPGQGQAVITKHICAQNCLKIVSASMAPVGRAGRPKGSATNGGTKPTATKGSTKKAQAPTSRKIKSTPVPAHQTTPENATETRADVVKAVRRITRTSTGGWAKGHNYRTERAMIAEREKISNK